jgi:hypothetical protein
MERKKIISFYVVIIILYILIRLIIESIFPLDMQFLLPNLTLAFIAIIIISVVVILMSLLRRLMN